MENGNTKDRFKVRIHCNNSSQKEYRNVESQPLVYTTSPTDKMHESLLWDEERRVPDILEDLETKNGGETGGNRLGTLTGVYCPTIQNIFGVILFIRMSWIVGVCGITEALLLIGMCCCTTFLTAISMSAIATNGRIQAGGSYYMISRNLGPSFGGSVGILFYLGTTFAASMYILGAIEIITKYIAPELSLNIGNEKGFFSIMFNDCRVYGTAMLFVMISVVYIGVKYVNYSANVFLAITVISILSIFAGFIQTAVSPSSKKISACLIGPQLLQLPVDGVCAKYYFNETTQQNQPTWLYHQFCDMNVYPMNKNKSYIGFHSSVKDNTYLKHCHPFFSQLSINWSIAVPGTGYGKWRNNIKSAYMKKGDFVRAIGYGQNDYILLNNKTANDMLGNEISRKLWITADITTNIAVLVGIFFPSCTGIMAGSNRSGDLADAGKSIPKGTLGAIFTTSTVYLLCVILFGFSVEGEVLRDKFGQSLSANNALMAAQIVWPHKILMLVGCLLSTCGAGLQSLTGAPRLLQSIAKDGIVPFLAPMAAGKPVTNEPTWAVLVTGIIAWIGILIAALDDYVAPFVTLFFLMCYLFVNVACVLQSFLKAPSWRPKWKYYHFSLSCVGSILCSSLMIMVGLNLLLIVLVLALSLYKYIAYKGAEKEWGDGIRGLYLTTARYALYQLPKTKIHTKNYRPQLLVFLDFDENKEILNPEIISVARQLKAGKGLSMFASVIQGDYLKKNAQDSKLILEERIQREISRKACKGFTNILMSTDVAKGITTLIQISGLGGLKHNTVLLSWPKEWRKTYTDQNEFLESLKTSKAAGLASVVAKLESDWPTSKIQPNRTIDIWWVIHDGGLIILLSYLLKQNPIWKNCRLRLFAVAEENDNSIKMEKDLREHLSRLRIDALVRVVELTKQDISAYAHERTIMMEQRCELLRQMGTKDIGSIAEESRHANHGDMTFKKSVPYLDNTMTWSPTHQKANIIDEDIRKTLNYRKMHNALSLNGAITNESQDAELVVINMPLPPNNYDQAREISYMEFIEALTDGIQRVLLVHGGGQEVVTAFS